MSPEHNIIYHVTGCHGFRHMVALLSLSNAMNVMSVYIHIYQRLCEAGYPLNYGLDSDAKMGEKIIQPPTNNVDYNKTQ